MNIIAMVVFLKKIRLNEPFKGIFASYCQLQII